MPHCSDAVRVPPLQAEGFGWQVPAIMAGPVTTSGSLETPSYTASAVVRAALPTELPRPCGRGRDSNPRQWNYPTFADVFHDSPYGLSRVGVPTNCTCGLRSHQVFSGRVPIGHWWASPCIAPTLTSPPGQRSPGMSGHGPVGPHRVSSPRRRALDNSSPPTPSQ